ncbi:MAG: ComEC family competence protein [Candidatus Yanofskybacteria bacterium]|nr:ComEC family competence protein [Candidatus Yanofskybacteria bacterium]
MHKSQVLALILAVFLLGIFVGSFYSIHEEKLLILLVIGLLILALSAYRPMFGESEQGIKKRRIGFVVGLLILVFAGGLFRFNAFNAQQSQLAQFVDREAGGKGIIITFRGYVDGDFSSDSQGAQFSFRIKEIIVPKLVIPIDEKVLVRTTTLPKYSFGEFLILKGTPRTPENFSDFDYVAYLQREGIRFTFNNPELQHAQTIQNLSFFEKERVNFYKSILGVRDSFRAAINRSVSEPNAAFINGILLGTRQNIPEGLKQSFAITGTSHVLAISGYNVAVVAQVLLLILVFWVKRKKAFWITVGAIIIFVILTGASASVMRAAIMGLLILFAQGYGRLYNPRNGILLAASLMALANPYVLRWDVGFQLSFAAVLGIFYVSPLLERLFRRVPDSMRHLLSGTLGAQLVVLPLILYYFHSISLVSLPTNILILPLIPAAMLLGFLTGIGGLVFPWLGVVLGSLAWLITEFQILVVNFFASLPGASLQISTSWITITLMYTALVGILSWLYRVKQYA